VIVQSASCCTRTDQWWRSLRDWSPGRPLADQAETTMSAAPPPGDLERDHEGSVLVTMAAVSTARLVSARQSSLGSGFLFAPRTPRQPTVFCDRRHFNHNSLCQKLTRFPRGPCFLMCAPSDAQSQCSVIVFSLITVLCTMLIGAQADAISHALDLLICVRSADYTQYSMIAFIESQFSVPC
jgi:hypothetical protein